MCWKLWMQGAHRHQQHPAASAWLAAAHCGGQVRGGFIGSVFFIMVGVYWVCKFGAWLQPIVVGRYEEAEVLILCFA